MNTPVTATFTTETGVDLVRPTVTLLDPASGAIAVPVNVIGQIRFSERINELSVTDSNFFVERDHRWCCPCARKCSCGS